MAPASSFAKACQDLMWLNKHLWPKQPGKSLRPWLPVKHLPHCHSTSAVPGCSLKAVSTVCTLPVAHENEESRPGFLLQMNLIS